MDFADAALELPEKMPLVISPSGLNNDDVNVVEAANIRSIMDVGNGGDDLLKPTDVFRSKKELKRERKLQKRLQLRSKWKLERKMKKLKNKERCKAQLTKTSFSNAEKPKLSKPKITPMADSANKIRVVIDFSYDELMSTKDLIKCGNQVVRCYSANRRSSNPIQLHFNNFSGKIHEEMSKCYAFEKWDINFHDNAYSNVFRKEELVYLTSESRNVLETLDESKVYIIGGLVDHNAHKGVSYRKAVVEGIAHAQLPIRKYIQMKSRSVLTINHVFEILLKVSNGESWSKALFSSVPQRFFENLACTEKSGNASETSCSPDKIILDNKRFQADETFQDSSTNEQKESCMTTIDLKES